MEFNDGCGTEDEELIAPREFEAAPEAALPGNMPAFEPIPSRGSELHGTFDKDGQPACQPCAWVYKEGGCRNAVPCKYCHKCPQGELKNRKKKKIARLRFEESAAQEQDEPAYVYLPELERVKSAPATCGVETEPPPPPPPGLSPSLSSDATYPLEYSIWDQQWMQMGHMGFHPWMLPPLVFQPPLPSVPIAVTPLPVQPPPQQAPTVITNSTSLQLPPPPDTEAGAFDVPDGVQPAESEAGLTTLQAPGLGGTGATATLNPSEECQPSLEHTPSNITESTVYDSFSRLTSADPLMLDPIALDRVSSYDSRVSSSDPSMIGLSPTYCSRSCVSSIDIDSLGLAQSQTSVRVEEGNDGKFHILWTVDARKLKTNNKVTVSPAFQVPSAHGNFKMMLLPKAVDERKGGASFKRAKGKGLVQVKCEENLEDPRAGVVTLQISVRGGNAEIEASDKQEPPRPSEPVMHDFAERGIFCLPKDQEEWDFGKIVSESQTFTVCLEVLPQHPALDAFGPPPGLSTEARCISASQSSDPAVESEPPGNKPPA